MSEYEYDDEDDDEVECGDGWMNIDVRECLTIEGWRALTPPHSNGGAWVFVPCSEVWPGADDQMLCAIGIVRTACNWIAMKVDLRAGYVVSEVCAVQQSESIHMLSHPRREFHVSTFLRNEVNEHLKSWVRQFADMDMRELRLVTHMPEETIRKAMHDASGNVGDALNLLCLGSDGVGVGVGEGDGVGGERDGGGCEHVTTKSDGWVSCLATQNVLVAAVVSLKKNAMEFTRRCVVCGHRLPMKVERPTACANEACVFSMENLGVGVCLDAEIACNSDLVQFHVRLFQAAIASRRAELAATCSTFFAHDGLQDGVTAEQLVEVAALIPPMAVGLTEDEFDMQERMQKAHSLVRPVLRWIVSSLRVHLKRITAPHYSHNDILHACGASQIYVMVSDTVVKEMAFQKHKAQSGSFYAFHGSSIVNWHSILRNGLRNYSNTQYMSAGAAHGKGIYVHQNLDYSWAYSAPLGSSKMNMACVALCEVSGKSFVSYDPKGITVIGDDTCVVTRYLLVFLDKARAKSIKANELAQLLVS